MYFCEMGKEMASDIFRFKQFSVFHGRSSMKVGVDGVLVGAWGCIRGERGIDIGCGCGLIGLMAAQRNSRCRIDMIDIHLDSIKEAWENIKLSGWEARLSARLADAVEFSREISNQDKYDFIISNPPFFNSGINIPDTPRETARHAFNLSPAHLVEIAGRLLKANGTLSMIGTAGTELPEDGILKTEKVCHVSDRPGRAPKRTLFLMRKTSGIRDTRSRKKEMLYIRDAEGEYSEAYINLTGKFYLNF